MQKLGVVLGALLFVIFAGLSAYYATKGYVHAAGFSATASAAGLLAVIAGAVDNILNAIRDK